MRFLDKMQKIFQGQPSDRFMSHMQETIDDVDTKRILFDARQAFIFAELGEAPPNAVVRNLLLPFDQFYLELTESIEFGEDFKPTEGGSNRYLQGILVMKPQHRMFHGQMRLFRPIVFMLTNRTNNLYEIVLDARGFLACLELDQVYSYRKTFLGLVKESGENDFRQFTSTGFSLTKADLEENLITVDDELVESLAGPVQIWYRNILSYYGLLQWLITYMTAKGVQVVEEKLSRQQRRLLARSPMPKPWHVVTVEPKFNQPGDHDDEGIQHRYRYDVMAHLRFNRHKLKDGSYRNTVEIVRPHQRGLNNETYIPKVSRFKAGKNLDPVTKEYLRQEG